MPIPTSTKWNSAAAWRNSGAAWKCCSARKPEAELDESRQRQAAQETERLSVQRERVAAAGGELLGAAFRFLDQLVQPADAAAPADNRIAAHLREQLSQCVQQDADGRQRLTVTLPDRSAIDTLAQTMARLLVAGQGNSDSGTGE